MKKSDSKQDKFSKMAKKDGYLARSVYKLEEIMKKNPKIFNNVQVILDLGCSPGSWSQYLLKKGKHIIGIDLEKTVLQHPNFTFFQEDIFNFNLDRLEKKPEAVISDMAPNTTGIRDRDELMSLELVQEAYQIYLQLHSKIFLAKVFESQMFHQWTKNLKLPYKLIRPTASMVRGSREIYILIHTASK